jgi:hypothetical protein
VQENQFLALAVITISDSIGFAEFVKQFFRFAIVDSSVVNEGLVQLHEGRKQHHERNQIATEHDRENYCPNNQGTSDVVAHDEVTTPGNEGRDKTNCEPVDFFHFLRDLLCQ